MKFKGCKKILKMTDFKSSPFISVQSQKFLFLLTQHFFFSKTKFSKNSFGVSQASQM